MNGFLFVILLFSALVGLTLFLLFGAKGTWSSRLAAVAATLSAWLGGLLLDANLDFGEPAGFLSLRTLFPILAMGICILNAVQKGKPD